MANKKKSATLEWIETIVIAVVLALFIRTFFVQSFKIPSGSMRQTLLEGDKILVNKLLYGPKIPLFNVKLPALREPRIGDIIVFKYPEDPKRDFIKRLIACENQSVKIDEPRVLVDGKETGVDAIDNRTYYAHGPFGEKEIVVAEGHFYTLGDNSSASKDSRYWGYVPADYVVGKAFFIFWPPHRIGVLK